LDQPGYILLSRLSAQLRATEILANNMANAETPGFRATRPVFAEHIEQQRNVARIPGNRDVAYALDRATWRDTTPGSLDHTGNPLDVAIQGDGFLVFETPRGERYGRAGRLTMGQDGRLVDMEGNAVLGQGGNPISLGPNDTRIEIMGDGTIRSENGVAGKLRIVRFDAPQRMQAEGDRLYSATEAPQDVARPAVVQGALEGSNVRAVLELTRLTGQVRDFQFAATFAERENDRRRDAVDRILRNRS
jgi:flagellar basal-body rod protein FlgF